MTRDYLNESIDFDEIIWPDLLNLFRILPRSRDVLINVIQARWLGEKDAEIGRLEVDVNLDGRQIAEAMEPKPFTDI